MVADASTSRRMVVTVTSTTIVATVVISTTMTCATPTSASAYAIPRRAPTTIAIAIVSQITIAVRCVEPTTTVFWLWRNTIGWELTIPSVSSLWWHSLQLLVAM
jgi:hypothetical protein